MGEPASRIRQRCAVIVPHEGRILLLRQNGNPFWVLPGGTLETGEALSDCAVRELQEELGWTVKLIALRGISEWLTPTKHVIDFFFQAEWLAGPTSWAHPHPENIDDIRWFTLDEIRALVDANLLQPASMASWLLQAFETDWQTWPESVYR
jgi:8-oxo-dGTP pyrophosphatase MutT (NUDIX family)